MHSGTSGAPSSPVFLASMAAGVPHDCSVFVVILPSAGSESLASGWALPTCMLSGRHLLPMSRSHTGQGDIVEPCSNAEGGQPSGCVLV